MNFGIGKQLNHPAMLASRLLKKAFVAAVALSYFSSTGLAPQTPSQIAQTLSSQLEHSAQTPQPSAGHPEQHEKACALSASPCCAVFAASTNVPIIPTISDVAGSERHQHKVLAGTYTALFRPPIS